MKVFLQNKPKFLFVLLISLLFIFNIASCINSCSQDSARKNEMAKRMGLEENLIKITQEKNSLAEKLTVKEKELEKDKTDLVAVRNSLEQEKLVCRNLKEELEKLNKVNAELEEDLKKALGALKKAKR